jgi:hypothetical protein
MKSVQELQDELPILQAELDACIKQVASINQLSANLQTLTTAHALGSVTASDLLQAQRLHDEALQAIPRQQLLTQSIREQKQMIDYAEAQEKRQFLDSISKQFADMREQYVAQSKQLLQTFKEMHRLHTVSMSMRSHTLMSDNDYRLDLPALRREADSELFTIGSMVRSGDL